MTFFSSKVEVNWSLGCRDIAKLVIVEGGFSLATIDLDLGDTFMFILLGFESTGDSLEMDSLVMMQWDGSVNSIVGYFSPKRCCGQINLDLVLRQKEGCLLCLFGRL